MNFLIISVGKKHPKELEVLISKYQKRIEAQHKVNWQIVAPTGEGSQGQQVATESQKILSYTKQGDYLILLDESGKIFDNLELVDAINRATEILKVKRIIFVIGGAYGVSQELKQKADLIWSLSKLVFPHQLVRLILLEQLYRSTSIINNHPYHHT